MATKQYRRSFMKQLWLPLIAVAFLGYFGFHAFNGYFGIWAKARLVAQQEALEAELAALVSRREALQRQANLLRPESLDPDMVDEQARAQLNLLDPRDVVIVTPSRR